MRWIALTVFALILFTASPAGAKEKKEKDKPEKESGESVISEIITLVKTQRPTEAEKEAQKTQRRERVGAILADLEQKGQITPEQKQKVLDALCEGKCDLTPPLPGGLKTDWKKVLKIDEFCETTAVRVLNDHLDQKDLKALLKFLKTPTGLKLIKDAPDMAAEAGELTAAKFLPPLIQMSKQFRMGPGIPGLGPEFPLSPEEQEKRKQLLDKLKEMLKQRERERAPHEET